MRLPRTTSTALLAAVLTAAIAFVAVFAAAGPPASAAERQHADANTSAKRIAKRCQRRMKRLERRIGRAKRRAARRGSRALRRTVRVARKARRAAKRGCNARLRRYALASKKGERGNRDPGPPAHANKPEKEPKPEPEPEPEPAPEPEPETEPEEETAVPPPPDSSTGSLAIGIEGGHDAWWQQTIDARAALGPAVTRHEFDPLEPIDSRDGVMLAAATEVQTRIHALLGANDLGDPILYRDWVLAFLARYGPGGAFWDEHPELDESRYAIASIELGNEPYFGAMSAAEYADAVRPALERVAALGLPVKVVLASRSYGGDTSWVDTLYERIPDLNSLFYAFAAHPYWYGHHPAEPGGAGPFERLDTLRRSMDDHGASGKPIYITEYGESTADCGSECVDEATQAEHLKAMIDAVVSRDDWSVELLSIFHLHDWATNSTNREQQFGILRHDGTQKPAYAIVREAMQQHRG